jgi:hypothetical protein
VRVRRTLAAEAAVALRQHRLRGREREFEREVLATHAGAVGAGHARETPVVDAHVGVLEACLDEWGEDARRALVVQQPPVGRVGERGVGEEELPRAEAARVVLRVGVSHAEESDLESERAARRVQVSRHVPPLDAMTGVRARIARK